MVLWDSLVLWDLWQSSCSMQDCVPEDAATIVSGCQWVLCNPDWILPLAEQRSLLFWV